jgi:hypothetical protein
LQLFSQVLFWALPVSVQAEGMRHPEAWRPSSLSPVSLL